MPADVFEFEERLYEVQGIAPVDAPGFHYECTDLTPGSGAWLGRIIVAGSGSLEGTSIQLAEPVLLPVLLRWMFFVPQLRSFGVDPAESGPLP